MNQVINEDNFVMYLVKLDFVQFGLVYIPVAGESYENAVNNAIETMTSLKHNDCSVESVSIMVEG